MKILLPWRQRTEVSYSRECYIQKNTKCYIDNYDKDYRCYIVRYGGYERFFPYYYPSSLEEAKQIIDELMIGDGYKLLDEKMLTLL